MCICSFQADSISGFHSNTHIPVVIGAQMRYEITGDPLYKVKFTANHATGELKYSIFKQHAVISLDRDSDYCSEGEQVDISFFKFPHKYKYWVMKKN